MELSAPLTVNWTLSYECNFSCSHCYSRGQNRTPLPLEKMLAVVEELARSRVAFVNFGGGEPLLYPHLFEITRRATELGLRVTMNTNGWRLDAEAARAAKAAGFASVGVSLDGPDDAVHDRFRNRPGSFERVLLALDHLKAADLPATASAVIHRENVARYREIVAIAAAHGAATVYLHNFKCSGRGMENRESLDLSPGEWRDFYADALAWREEAPAALAFDDPVLALLGESESGAVKGSTCGKLSLHIEPDGDATPCGFIPLVVGNVLEEGGLKKIWKESPILARMRNKTPEGKCRSCDAYGECLGGCTARALAVTGDFNAPDPHCWREEGTESA